MVDEEHSSRNINISDVSNSEINIGQAITGQVGGDVVGGDKVVGDKVERDKYETHIHTPLTLEQQRQQRNREIMLERVDLSWVKGVLEKSLYTEVLIELGWKERAEMVERPPWILALHDGDQTSELPPGTPMVEVFDKVGQNLLILGEPGSGKTMMLLELARDTIKRAHKDKTLPIPVVFNLSSWTDPNIPIADWLVVELNTKYGIPKAIAKDWIEQDALMLLLDGLDEVAGNIRDECVRVINDFRDNHLVQVVVCSRIKDYEQLTTHLNLDSAVFINPLSSEQIVEYLGDDEKTKAVRVMLRYDSDLQTLAQTPLMLSIMVLAYQGLSEGELKPVSSTEARREHLFNTYISRMFERHEAGLGYTTEQTVEWLAWLAQGMRQASLTVFLIERLQPNWLSTQWQRRTHSIGSVLIIGLIGVLFLELIIGLFGRLVGWLSVGVFVVLFRVPNAGLTGDIVLIEKLEWSWADVRAGLILVLSVGLFVGLIGWMSVGLSVGLIFGLIFGLSGVLIAGLFFGPSGKPSSVEASIIPNQGIWQSGKNALTAGVMVGLFGGLLTGLIVGLSVGLIFGLSGWLNVGFGIGLGGGAFGVLNYGGKAFIQHFILRFILYLKGYAPWGFATFLNYAAELIFLRKVGGGYIFIHRLLLEHFASLTPEDINRLASETSGRN